MSLILAEPTNFVFPDEFVKEAHENDYIMKAFRIGGDSIDIVKSEKSPDKLIIQGECSNTDLDMDGEAVMSKGMILDYAIREGKVIWGHTPKNGVLPPQYVLGVPIELKPFAKALFIKAELNRGNPNAVQVYNLMAGMPGNHGIGWSIEGGSLLKKGNIVHKSLLRNVSLYHNVKNLSTWADIVKAQTTGGVSAVMIENLDDTLTRQVRTSFDDPRLIEKYFTKNHKGKYVFKSFTHGLNFFKNVHKLSEEQALDKLREIKRQGRK